MTESGTVGMLRAKQEETTQPSLSDTICDSALPRRLFTSLDAGVSFGAGCTNPSLFGGLKAILTFQEAEDCGEGCLAPQILGLESPAQQEHGLLYLEGKGFRETQDKLDVPEQRYRLIETNIINTYIVSIVQQIKKQSQH